MPAEPVVTKPIKMVLVIRADTEPPMRKGKACTQAVHAAMGLIFDSVEYLARQIFTPDELCLEWRRTKHRTITCKAVSQEVLFAAYEEAIGRGIRATLIQDSGLTEFKEPTYTAVSIGPDWDERIDAITGHLPLF